MILTARGPPAPVGLARHGSRHAGEPKILSCSLRSRTRRHSVKNYTIVWAGMQRRYEKRLPHSSSLSVICSVSGLAHIDQRKGVGAGVGRDDAAQIEGSERSLAEGFAAGFFQLSGLGDGSVADHIIEVLHALGALFAQVDYGGDDLVVAAHLALHPGLAVDEGDDGADAHQLAHDRGGGRDAAALLHLLEAVGSEDDLHLVHLGLKLADDVAELRAILQLAGHLAQIPAEHHRVGVGVEQMDIQVMFRALLPQHPLRHDGVVVGGRTGAVDGDMDDIGVALVHILAVFLTELDGGDGSRGGDALGGAHLVVELLGGVLFTLHDVFVVQQDVEAHNVDAVFLGQLLRDVAGGVGQNRDFAHSVPHFHS